MGDKPQTLAMTSAFEILGPIMVGPSSSHTAGALRCAQVASSLLEGHIVEARFYLRNSFAHTYRGHGTDRALLAGIMGLGTDDERIRDAFQLAHERGLEFSFETMPDDKALHPNTVDMHLVDEFGTSANVRGESLGGGKVRISRINDVAIEITGAYATLFVAHHDEPGVLAALTNLLAYAHVNIAACHTYRTEAGGRAYSVFEADGAPADAVLPLVRQLDPVYYATFVKVPGTGHEVGPGISAEELFDNGAQLLQACAERGLSIGAVMQLREERLTGAERAATAMQRVLSVMRSETRESLEAPKRSLGGFIGGEAKRIAEADGHLQDALMGTVLTDAVARAMAVLERSAGMGVIVAAPTAGSAGVVPGSILALADHLGVPDVEIIDALYCAAAVGQVLTTSACVAGAEGGCQAEVGSAAAMAAAACVQLLGGTPEESLHAGSLALQNLLGLVCDPVGGLVEVPCQNRNAIGVACAFSSAQLALSGVKSLVPFDEMAKVMLDVGHALPASLRETAKGGIAAAPSARAACEGCGTCG